MKNGSCSCGQKGAGATMLTEGLRSPSRPIISNEFLFESEPFAFPSFKNEWEGEDEWSVGEWESMLTEAEYTPTASARPCPINSPRMARDRCTRPGSLACPTIPDLMCVSSVGSIPFEYPTSVKRDAGGMYTVRARKSVTQRFTPPVGLALSQFLVHCAAFGMPVEAILTAGSLYCRCISKTNTLSNHSYGDAIDIVGIRWRSAQGARETIVHNYANAAERALLRRINAALRLPFATVIDYHRADHRDHFHCDMNRGNGRSLRGKATVVFVQEALNQVLGAGLSEDGGMGQRTLQALSRFSGHAPADFRDDAVLRKVQNNLFLRVARG